MEASKTIVIFTLLSFITFCTIAQTKEEKEHLFIKVELKANTNPYAWSAHIKKCTALPDSLIKHIPNGTYVVNVEFIVDRDGSIRNVKAVNDPGYGLAKKAVAVITGYKGEWSAASQCGRLVKSYVEQPVRFVIAK